MTDSRTEILARIASSLGRTGEPDERGVVPPDHPAPEVPRPPGPGPRLGEDDLIELMTDRLTDYNASVCVLPAAEVPTAIADLLTGASTIVAPHDLDESWLAQVRADAGVEVLSDSVEDPCSAETLNQVDAVITGSTVAIADTGTIALSGPQCGRRAITLVPDRHICLLRTADIVRQVPEAVRILIDRGLQTAPQTWVSGPSATVDIELERVAGVHGPRTLDVLLVRE